MVGSRPRLIAHRGFAAEFPENTLCAVSRSISRADAIELDVRRCASGEAVLVHDARLGPFGLFGRVDRHPAELLADRGVPTLDAALEILPEDFPVVLDLKSPDAVDPVLSRLATSDRAVLLSAANEDILAHVRRRAPSLPRAYVHVPPRPLLYGMAIGGSLRERAVAAIAVESILDRTEAFGCRAIHARWELCRHSSLVERAHARELAVAAWTVKRAESGEALTAVGVDGIIADTWRGLPRPDGH